MPSFFHLLPRRTVSCPTGTRTCADLVSKELHDTIQDNKAQKPPMLPPTVSQHGFATLFGRFARHAVPSDHALANATTTSQFLAISQLHPLEDPTLVGPHTMVPVIRRESDSKNEWSMDWTREEIHPIYGGSHHPKNNASRTCMKKNVDPPLECPPIVADRIAQFETMRSGSKTTIMTSKRPSLVVSGFTKEGPALDEIVLELFLHAIGETPPAGTSPKLVSIATEWWETVKRNQEVQLGDEAHVSLSSTFNLLDAALDPKCASLEVQALGRVGMVASPWFWVDPISSIENKLLWSFDVLISKQRLRLPYFVVVSCYVSIHIGSKLCRDPIVPFNSLSCFATAALVALCFHLSFFRL